MVEYPCDPPLLTSENQQSILKDPLIIDKEGFLKIPDKPGIGVEIDEEKVVFDNWRRDSPRRIHCPGPEIERG